MVGGFLTSRRRRICAWPRQAVSALDVTQIPEFEHRVDPVADRREYIIELGPPAHFLAHLEYQILRDHESGTRGSAHSGRGEQLARYGARQRPVRGLNRRERHGGRY
jgi:hypothetical protein